MTRVVAVDPGTTTGLAWWSDEDWLPEVSELPLFDALTLVHNALALRQLTAVVCEDYVITAMTVRKGRETGPTDGIGALRYLCHAYGVPLSLQRAAEAKTFVSNERLRAVGWYARGQDHGRDATRHLLLYLVREGVIPAERVRV